MRIAQVMLTLVIVLLIAAPGLAQEKKKRTGRGRISPTAQAMIKMMKIRDTLEAMDLTAEQQEQLKKQRDEAGPKMKDLFEKMAEILTDEQKATAQKVSTEAREADKKGRQLVMAVETAMKLTDEQKEKLAKFAPEINTHQKAMLKGIRSVLTPEQQEVFKKKMAPTRKKGGKKKES